MVNESALDCLKGYRYGTKLRWIFLLLATVAFVLGSLLITIWNPDFKLPADKKTKMTQQEIWGIIVLIVGGIFLVISLSYFAKIYNYRQKYPGNINKRYSYSGSLNDKQLQYIQTKFGYNSSQTQLIQQKLRSLGAVDYMQLTEPDYTCTDATINDFKPVYNE